MYGHMYESAEQCLAALGPELNLTATPPRFFRFRLVLFRRLALGSRPPPAPALPRLAWPLECAGSAFLAAPAQPAVRRLGDRLHSRDLLLHRPLRPGPSSRRTSSRSRFSVSF